MVYISVKKKYLISLVIATCWVGFSIYMALPWISSIEEVTNIYISVFVVAFIAFIPAFANFFMVSSMCVDNRGAYNKHIGDYPKITILVAAYNEEENIVSTLESICSSDYCGKMEVVVIDDGSIDNTLSLVQQFAKTDDRIVPLAMSKNSGKSSALNYGLSYATNELIVTVDADTKLHNKAIRNLVSRMLTDPANTCAVAGSIALSNPNETIMTKLQTWDYLLSISASKRAQSLYQGTLVAQGAFSIYKKSAIVHVGGWPNCIGEDIVLTWAFFAHDYRVGHAEDAIAFTTAPSGFLQFAKQRIRWSRGLIEAFKTWPSTIIKLRMSSIFVLWNLLFPVLDAVFTFVMIPGIIAALFFEYYLLASVWTLYVLPLGLLLNGSIYWVQHKTYRTLGIPLIADKSKLGIVMFTLFYSFLLQPVCLYGYISEFIRTRKTWGTK